MPGKVCTFLFVATCAAGQQMLFEGKTWWHPVEVLAADDKEGHGTGTPGLDRADPGETESGHGADEWCRDSRCRAPASNPQ